jgi:hypothetical protein
MFFMESKDFREGIPCDWLQNPNDNNFGCHIFAHNIRALYIKRCIMKTAQFSPVEMVIKGVCIGSRVTLLNSNTIEAGCGMDISTVSRAAKLISSLTKKTIHFDFNGRKVFVNAATNLDSLLRDFHNWNLKSIGPFPKKKTSKKAAEKLEAYNRQQQEAAEKRSSEYRKQQLAMEAALAAEVENVAFLVKDGVYDEYQKWVLINSQDGYSKAVVTYAQKWACLMQSRSENNSVAEIAKKASHDADVEGITGFMYGAAVAALAAFWVHGEELKRWHNGDYGQPDAAGVVNPAVFTIVAK